MLRTYLKSIFVSLLTVTCFNSTMALAIELDEASRTIPFDSTGKTVVLTPEQVKRGKRLFNSHVVSVTRVESLKQIPMLD